jgi:hypothetical protein
MNPYTNSLLERIQDPWLKAWVADWDAFEGLIIDVFRQGKAPAARRRQFRDLKSRLRREYPRFQQELKPHWQGRRAGGKPVQNDPFLVLLDMERAEDSIDNWRVMQLLPAAREAINLCLHQLLEGAGRRQ